MARNKLSFDSTQKRRGGAASKKLPPDYRDLESFQIESFGTGMQQSKGRAGEGARSDRYGHGRTKYGVTKARVRRRESGTGRFFIPEGN